MAPQASMMPRLPIATALLAACMLVGLPLPAVSNGAAAGQPAILLVDGRESEELWIVTESGRFRFTAEIADDADERARGLMYRQSMPPTHGMLFDFGQTQIVEMWMANTPLSLDMVFADSQGKVTHIAERTAPQSREIISSQLPASHVLEINAGISKLIGLKPGARLEHRLFEAQ